MASDPIPEPLSNQEIDRAREPRFSPERRLAEVLPRRKSNTRLNEAAEAIGTALGQAVNTAREASRQGSGVAEESKQAVQDKVLRAKGRTAETLDDVRDSSAQAYEDVRDKTVEIIENARRRARYLADEYPLQIIATAAGLGFLAGVQLRIRRSVRD